MRKSVKTVLLCLLTVVLAVSGFKIYEIVSEYMKASSSYNNAADAVVSSVSQTDGITPPIEVDFETLVGGNGSIVGWIYCEGTAINYPVVQGSDNSYYVRRLPDGTKSTAGSIFVDYRCAADCSDTNTILYGHNMKNGSMFATIKKYGKQSFYDEHPVMWYFTPDETFMVELVAGYVTSTGSESFEMFTDTEDIQQYLSMSVEKSTFVTNASIETAERVMTLATCSYEYDNARYVLVGVLLRCDK